MSKHCHFIGKVDPLTNNIFWIYNIHSLDKIKYVAFHKP